ncbi:MAG: glycosyltransferase family 39 protein [Planctomycetota bacterium]|nr:glycosyltransferase family 39 protein [Planctomycetota bacterium]
MEDGVTLMEDRQSIIDPSGEFRKSEFVVVVLLLSLLIGLQLCATGAVSLISRKLWIDEIFTTLLLSDPDFGHALSALKNGGPDHHPPTYYLLARGLFSASVDELRLRCLSLAIVVLALAGTYVLLRNICGPYAAMAAVLALWCHPLIITHAFEARPYGLWLAASVWLTVFINQVQRRPARWYSHVMLAVTAAVLCTVHYFGIVTLLLIASGHVVIRKVPLHKELWSLSALLAGPVALAVCSPFLLTQRSALTVPTWIAPLSATYLVTFVVDLVPIRAIIAGGVVVLLLRRFACREEGSFQRKTSGGSSRSKDHPVGPGNSDLGGVFGLSLLPFVMIGMSYFVQPVQLARYALPAVVVFGVLFAYWFRALSRPKLAVVCVLFALLGAFELHRYAKEQQQFDENVDRVIAEARSHGTDGPVIFVRPLWLFPVVHYAPDLADRCFLLEFDTNRPGGLYYPHLFIQELVQRVQRFYGRPQMLDATTLARYPYAKLLLLEGQHPKDFAFELRGYTISSTEEIPMGEGRRGIVCLLAKSGTRPLEQETGNPRNEFRSE